MAPFSTLYCAHLGEKRRSKHVEAWEEGSHKHAFHQIPPKRDEARQKARKLDAYLLAPAPRITHKSTSERRHSQIKLHYPLDFFLFFSYNNKTKAMTETVARARRHRESGRLRSRRDPPYANITPKPRARKLKQLRLAVSPA